MEEEFRNTSYVGCYYLTIRESRSLLRMKLGAKLVQIISSLVSLPARSFSAVFQCLPEEKFIKNSCFKHHLFNLN